MLPAILAQYRVPLEPFFLEVLNNGPDPQLLADVSAVASRSFDRRQKLLATGTGSGLSGADLDAARKVDRAQYLTQAAEMFVTSYKAQAVGGLGIVAGPMGRAILQALANDPKSPLRISAQEALRKL